MKKEEALDILDDNHTKLVNYDYSDEELGKAHNTAINSLENQCDFWDLEAGTCRKTEVPVNNSKAEPIKPKTGRWKRISPAGIYECSECGQNVLTGDIKCYQFCHGCGAKMKGV